MPQHKGSVPPNKIIMSQFQIDFVKENFKNLTNDEISLATGLSKTYVRMYAYSIGLQRELIINWTAEQEKFLLENWRKIGNIEMANIINSTYPGNKIFNKKTISKKLTLLGLKRNIHETFIIRERNRLNGLWGNPNHSKDGKDAPKLYISINAKTKVEVPFGKTIDEVKEKYSYLNFL